MSNRNVNYFECAKESEELICGYVSRERLKNKRIEVQTNPKDESCIIRTKRLYQGKVMTSQIGYTKQAMRVIIMAYLEHLRLIDNEKQLKGGSDE